MSQDPSDHQPGDSWDGTEDRNPVMFGPAGVVHHMLESGLIVSSRPDTVLTEARIVLTIRSTDEGVPTLVSAHDVERALLDAIGKTGTFTVTADDGTIRTFDFEGYLEANDEDQL